MKKLIAILLLLSFNAHAKNRTDGGRFQIVQPNEMRADQYLLDTETGRVWQMIGISEDGKIISKEFHEMFIENLPTSQGAKLIEQPETKWKDRAKPTKP